MTPEPADMDEAAIDAELRRLLACEPAPALLHRRLAKIPLRHPRRGATERIAGLLTKSLFGGLALVGALAAALVLAPDLATDPVADRAVDDTAGVALLLGDADELAGLL